VRDLRWIVHGGFGNGATSLIDTQAVEALSFDSLCASSQSKRLAAHWRSAALAILVTVSFGATANAAPSKDRASVAADAVRLATSARPNFKWAVERTAVVDVNCDGHADYAIPGTDGRTFAVAVVLWPADRTSQLTILEFGIGDAARPDSLCGDTAGLSIDSSHYEDPVAVDGHPLPGFRRSSPCDGLEVVEPHHGPFHIFWNYDAKRVEWWRYWEGALSTSQQTFPSLTSPLKYYENWKALIGRDPAAEFTSEDDYLIRIRRDFNNDKREDQAIAFQSSCGNKSCDFNVWLKDKQGRFRRVGSLGTLWWGYELAPRDSGASDFLQCSGTGAEFWGVSVRTISMQGIYYDREKSKALSKAGSCPLAGESAHYPCERCSLKELTTSKKCRWTVCE
jgi:hypothetical protein